MNYWRAITKNGDVRNEQSVKWSDIENDIEELSLIINSNSNQQKITLPKGYEYVQAKTASADLNGENAVIESKYIGIIIGNNIMKVRVDEKTNNISVEIE